MRIDRLDRIERYILQEQTVSLDRLAKEFGLSVNTIRRDVTQLEARGFITRIHGGVTALKEKKVVSMTDRIEINREAKASIGRLAAGIVRDGISICLDAGSTTTLMVGYLKDKKNITLVTSGVSVLNEVIQLPNINLVVLGGEYVPSSGSFHRLTALEDLKQFNIDIAFLGATGVTAGNGLTTMSFMEASIKQGIIERAKTVAALVDSSKYGNDSLLKFADLGDLDYFITNEQPPDDMQEIFAQKNVQVLY